MTLAAYEGTEKVHIIYLAGYLTGESSNTPLFSFIIELLSTGGAPLNDFKPRNTQFKSVPK
jgi:hypothetical protein